MKRFFPTLFFIGILILGAFLRLYRIADYMTFLGDEGRDVLVAYNILHGHFTLLGPTSSVGGFFLGPIYYYFMAPFLWLFNYDPVGPAVMVAIFGIITIWFVYKIGNEFFNCTTALIAAFLFAISPLVVAYSRSSWNPNLMPIFTIFTLFSLYKAVQKTSLKLFTLSGIFLGILLQLHYLATFVGGIVFIYVLFTEFIFGKKLLSSTAKKFGAILIGFLFGLSPYLAFEARHGFPNTMSIFAFIFHSKDINGGGNSLYTIQNVFFRIFGRLLTDFPPPEQVSLQAHTTIFIWYALTLLLALVSTGYFLWKYYLKSKIKNQESKNDKLLQFSLIFTWFFVGIFIFGFYKKSIYDYYLEFLFPLPFLLVGYFLSFLLSKKIYWKILAIGIFCGLSYINLQAIPFRYAPNRQLAQARLISQFVLDKTQNEPYNFALITGGNSDHAYRYFFTLWNKAPVVILNPQIDPQRKSVTNQLMIVCESSCAPLGNSLWEVAGFGRAEIVGKWPVSVVTVYRLVHYQKTQNKK